MPTQIAATRPHVYAAEAPVAAHMGTMMIKVLALGWALSLAPAWRWLKRNAARRRAAAALLASDPHILRDIGIEREELFFMAYGQPGAEPVDGKALDHGQPV